MPVSRLASRSLLALVVAAATLSGNGSPALARPAPATGASSAAVNYVALGDSYSAGVGSGDYISASGSCQRSTRAYPALWAAATHPASYISVACGKATTSTVIGGQLSALSSHTTLVSVTVGGNNVGFESVMETCYFLFLSTSACVGAIDGAEAKISSEVPGALDQLLADIAARAPGARVVVLGYPDFYDLSRSCTILNSTDRTDIDQAINLLDTQLQAAAARYRDIFADVRPAFAGHQICDSSSWIHTIDWLSLGQSFHPTAAGQSGGYYPVFKGAAG